MNLKPLFNFSLTLALPLSLSLALSACAAHGLERPDQSPPSATATATAPPKATTDAPAEKADSRPPVPSKMTVHAMAFLMRGPAWSNARTPETERLDQGHAELMHGLLESGQVLMAGPIEGDGPLRGAMVFDAESEDAARAALEADPAVKAGRLKVELHPWYTMKDALKPVTKPIQLTTYYLALLRRGASWGPEETPERARIQEAHMANINRLAAAGTLVSAGPFGDDGDLRGIFIFKVGSLEEAIALTRTDPAVQAGRLAMELLLWKIPAGVLP